MAQKIMVSLVDDIDGGEAAETVTFAVDGVQYEMDLSTKNGEKFRKAITPFVDKARRVGRAKDSRTATATAHRSRSAASNGGGGKLDLTKVRAWARENGYQVSERGRVSGEIQKAYQAAH